MLKRAFLAYVLVEMAVLVGLTWAIGLGWTLLVVFATAVAGVAMAGSQAKRQLTRLRQAQSKPEGALADGMLVALGTVLVFVPGLVTSLLGTLMLLPPTRAAVRPVAGALLSRGLFKPAEPIRVASLGGSYPGAGYPGSFADYDFGNTHAGRGDYIDGEVIDEQVYAPVHEASNVRRCEA